MPFSRLDPLLDVLSVGLGRLGAPPFMACLIAEFTRRYDVLADVFPAILFGLQMFRRALEAVEQALWHMMTL